MVALDYPTIRLADVPGTNPEGLQEFGELGGGEWFAMPPLLPRAFLQLRELVAQVMRPEAIGETLLEDTLNVSEKRKASRRKALRFQSLTVWSALAVSRLVPSGPTAAE